MSLWTYFQGLCKKPGQKLLLAPIDATHVQVDPPIKPMAITAKSTYIRLRLAEMFLSKQVMWGTGLSLLSIP